MATIAAAEVVTKIDVVTTAARTEDPAVAVDTVIATETTVAVVDGSVNSGCLKLARTA